jgi:hypothetical protein
MAKGKVKQSTTSKEPVAPSTSATDVSASTIRGYASALNCFEPYARSIEFESLEVIPETLITEAFFASLCNYLYDLEHTTGTLLQYLSGAYNYFSSKYDLPLFKIDRDPITKAPAWYSKMRFRLQTNLKKKAIENGEKIQPNKAASCGRELLKSIARAHLRIDTVESIEHRAENVCAWLSCGSGSCDL